MIAFMLRKLTRRCPVCRARIQGEGVRRGLRLFCSAGHAEKFAEEREARRRALSRMSGKTGGGCC
jgi:hypothetical protein